MCPGNPVTKLTYLTVHGLLRRTKLSVVVHIPWAVTTFSQFPSHLLLQPFHRSLPVAIWVGTIQVLVRKHPFSDLNLSAGNLLPLFLVLTYRRSPDWRSQWIDTHLLSICRFKNSKFSSSDLPTLPAVVLQAFLFWWPYLGKAPRKPLLPISQQHTQNSNIYRQQFLTWSLTAASFRKILCITSCSPLCLCAAHIYYPKQRLMTLWKKWS